MLTRARVRLSVTFTIPGAFLLSPIQRMRRTFCGVRWDMKRPAGVPEKPIGHFDTVLLTVTPKKLLSHHYRLAHDAPRTRATIS